MFFIARCLFWFSVIYVHLPEGGRAGVDAGRFLDMAGAHVDALARQQGTAVATRAAEGGAAWCQANGEACADAVLAAMAASRQAGEIVIGKKTSARTAAQKGAATRG